MTKSKTRKIPLRRCLVTNEMVAKKELLRIVKTPEGNIVVDQGGKLNGRGAYIKKDEQVLEIAIKKKVFEKAFEMAIDSSIYEQIRQLLRK